MTGGIARTVKADEAKALLIANGRNKSTKKRQHHQSHACLPVMNHHSLRSLKHIPLKGNCANHEQAKEKLYLQT